jgi:hypothetical protein
MLRQRYHILTLALLIANVFVGLGQTVHADERADYQALCDIWRKTEPEAGQKAQEVTADERSLLLRELDAKRTGIAPHDFRRMAAITLGNLRATEAVEKLISRLSDASEYHMVSAEAGLALGKIGDSRALGPLVDALLDDRTLVRTYAAQGLRFLKPSADQIASVVNAQRLDALLAKAEVIPLPESEREWMESGSTTSNKAYGTARELDAICTGLQLAERTKQSNEQVQRARKLAEKLLDSGFPASAFQSETMLPDLRAFCQRMQPELFAKKVAA